MEKKEIMFFSRAQMIKFFREFDYLDIKCEPYLNNLNPDQAALVKKAMCDYELGKSHTIYADIKYYDVFEKIKKIYGNENDIARKMTFLYDFAISRLLDRYVDIDTLVKLFNHHFFEFEWRQHIDYNFKENSLSFYRDHFIHQIRNCYMILEVLESKRDDSGDNIKIINSPLMTKIKEVLNSSLDNELIKYIRVHKNNYSDVIRERVESIKKKYIPIDDKDKSHKDRLDKRAMDTVKKNISDYALEFLIRGTFIIAALFHDIGYPVVFMRENSDQLNDFIASIFPQDGLSFERLNELLGTSLLFTLVPKNVLKTMYEKHDHGAFSAFILLLHFYETGTIRSLGDVKKAMIELAALAIFNHTVGNYYNDKHECGYKPSFTSDPISYTLRFIDDLQEWERVYFEVRQSGDLIYCEKCKMPIIKKWDKDIKNAISNKAETYIDEKVTDCFNQFEKELLRDFDYISAALPEYNMKRLYVCGCNDGKKNCGVKDLDNWHYSTGAYEKGTLFPDRRIIYTVTCTNVVHILSGNSQKFYLDYDPFRSFYLLTLNPHALDYRIKELKNLNDQFAYQENIDLEMVSDMTNNPLMLKLRMLCSFLYELGYYAYYVYQINNSKNNLTARSFFQKINPIYLDLIDVDNAQSLFKCISSLSSKLEETGVFVYNYQHKNHEFKKGDYYDADKIKGILGNALDSIVEKLMGAKCNKKYKNNLKNILKVYLDILYHIIKKEELSLKYSDKFEFGSFYTNCCEYLIADATKQINCLRENGSLVQYYKNYFNKDMMGEVIQTVMDPRYYKPYIIKNSTVNVNPDEIDFFDAFSDLYLFKEMYRFSQDNVKRRMGEYIPD